MKFWALKLVPPLRRIKYRKSFYILFVQIKNSLIENLKQVLLTKQISVKEKKETTIIQLPKHSNY